MPFYSWNHISTSMVVTISIPYVLKVAETVKFSVSSLFSGLDQSLVIIFIFFLDLVFNITGLPYNPGVV